jgi:hypothetical protein
MKAKGKVIRKTISVWLSALLLILSIAVPALARAEFAHEPAIESEHNPAHCPRAHDHTVCTQVGANLSLAAAPTLSDHTQEVISVTAPIEAPASAHSVFEYGHPSRAPPLA